MHWIALSASYHYLRSLTPFQLSLYEKSLFMYKFNVYKEGLCNDLQSVNQLLHGGFNYSCHIRCQLSKTLSVKELINQVNSCFSCTYIVYLPFWLLFNTVCTKQHQIIKKSELLRNHEALRKTKNHRELNVSLRHSENEFFNPYFVKLWLNIRLIKIISFGINCKHRSRFTSNEKLSASLRSTISWVLSPSL